MTISYLIRSLIHVDMSIKSVYYTHLIAAGGGQKTLTLKVGVAFFAQAGMKRINLN